ncbi:hypothetical protein ElyMa_003363300 [Elysia marginata]|uniref:Uncharacterized protein n=1 Tax=Elysia marginata TaxID=1093978 RepID=A0AAV4JHZ3_9GAST|nr:hypothetical protein ElyMa_003363300 [Elysia marginata]
MLLREPFSYHASFSTYSVAYVKHHPIIPSYGFMLVKQGTGVGGSYLSMACTPSTVKGFDDDNDDDDDDDDDGDDDKDEDDYDYS